jgi:hypothetical protein
VITRNCDIFICNAQSLADKLVELEVILAGKNYSAICVCKHWYTSDTLVYGCLNGYNLATAFCRTNKTRGGVAIYVRDEIRFQVLDIKQFCFESHCEVVAATLYLQSTTINLVSTY